MIIMLCIGQHIHINWSRVDLGIKISQSDRRMTN